jgi:hypothetical protein
MAAPTTPAPSTPQRDWTDQATETIESVVLSVKEKTTLITTIARGVVYGLVIAALGVVMLLVLIMALVRLAASYIPSGEQYLWAVYLALGILSCAGGLVCWSKRTPKESR